MACFIVQISSNLYTTKSSSHVWRDVFISVGVYQCRLLEMTWLDNRKRVALFECTLDNTFHTHLG